MSPASKELYQVCVFDDAEDSVLIPLWQEENTRVVLFVWGFFPTSWTS